MSRHVNSFASLDEENWTQVIVGVDAGEKARRRATKSAKAKVSDTVTIGLPVHTSDERIVQDATDERVATCLLWKNNKCPHPIDRSNRHWVKPLNGNAAFWVKHEDTAKTFTTVAFTTDCDPCKYFLEGKCQFGGEGISHMVKDFCVSHYYPESYDMDASCEPMVILPAPVSAPVSFDASVFPVIGSAVSKQCGLNFAEKARSAPVAQPTAPVAQPTAPVSRAMQISLLWQKIAHAEAVVDIAQSKSDEITQMIRNAEIVRDTHDTQIVSAKEQIASLMAQLESLVAPVSKSAKPIQTVPLSDVLFAGGESWGDASCKDD